MTVEIIIDSREPMLHALLETYHQNTNLEQQSCISFKTRLLDVGDVEIKFENISILIERKSCADLAASIKDNRYKEQKIRLLAKSLPQHIIYILEGVPSLQTLMNTDFPIHGMKPSVLSGMMVYTMLRDGIHVVSVPNMQETAAWIWSIALKCLTNPEKIRTNQNGAGSDTNTTIDYLEHIKVKKIENMTPNNCYLMQLCQIPNVSHSTANEIAKKYPTMIKLLSALSDLPDTNSRIKCLSDIPMIGKKRAVTLLDYMLSDINSI